MKCFYFQGGGESTRERETAPRASLAGLITV